MNVTTAERKTVPGSDIQRGVHNSNVFPTERRLCDVDFRDDHECRIRALIINDYRAREVVD